MGILYFQARMLLDARKAGMPMDDVLTIGRQALFLHPSELRRVRESCPGALPGYRWGEFADRYIAQCLHARQIHSLDYSSYEGADLLHDLNKPVPEIWHGKYDVVIEAGTLEHIFNFPTAVANLMKMTKAGGTMFVSMVANNLCGHGFYQFSPELVFRIFSAGNGFRLGRVFAIEQAYPGVELKPASAAYEVIDPALAGDRVGLLTRHPIMLFFDAVKIADVPLFSVPPIQSDYAATWAKADQATASAAHQAMAGLPGYSSLRRWLASSGMVHGFRQTRTGRRQKRQFSLTNQRFFRRLNKP